MTDGQEINMLKLEVAALKQQLHTERESLKKEMALVREDNKKLAQQVDDYTNQLRKVALL